MDIQEAVIMVVGAKTDYKTNVADELAKGRCASSVETTKAGVRIFSRESCPKPIVVETTALVINENRSVEENARVWIALNSLRRVSAKLIFVVYVVISSDLQDPVEQEAGFPRSKLTWLNQLTYIFKEHQLKIMILVKLEGPHNSDATKRVRDVLQQQDGFETISNISVETFTTDLRPSITLALEHSVYGDEAGGKSNGTSLKSLLLKESNAEGVDKPDGPWGPNSVILFGRTGSGKSTLAQMFTLGRLDPGSEDFASSSGIRGETKELKQGVGRGWSIVDTPGFGEPKDKLSTISSEEAERKIKRYIELIEGTYTHFLYMVMRDRIDELDKRLWKFFVKLFRDNIKNNFSVVISNASVEWVKENRADLKESFKGCDSFLSAEFPTTKSDDTEWEAELQEVRTESLKQLEEELAVLQRYPVNCEYSGGFWKTTSKHMTASGAKFKRLVTSVTCNSVSEAVKSHIRNILNVLKQDDHFLLLPSIPFLSQCSQSPHV